MPNAATSTVATVITAVWYKARIRSNSIAWCCGLGTLSFTNMLGATRLAAVLWGVIGRRNRKVDSITILRRPTMCFRLSSVLVFLLAAGVALAQSTASSPPAEPSVQELLDRIERLEKRVSELEEHERTQAGAAVGGSGRQAAVPAQAGQMDAPSSSSHEHMAPSVEVQEAETHYPSLQVRGFGDVDFSATDQKGTNSGFNMGQFVLHFASALSGKVSYFGEVSFTAEPTTYELAVERSIIRYDYNDDFKLSFGKYHTPLGYWNAAYHHGAWLQTSISRPEMIKFGGSLIPVHFVGAEAEGNIPSGGLGLGYSLGLGNGRGTPFSKAGDSGDVNNNRAWVASVFARPA